MQTLPFLESIVVLPEEVVERPQALHRREAFLLLSQESGLLEAVAARTVADRTEWPERMALPVEAEEAEALLPTTASHLALAATAVPVQSTSSPTANL